MDFREEEKRKHILSSGFRFFLTLDIISPGIVLKAPFMSVGILGVAHIGVAFIMPVRSDRNDVLADLIVQALHQFFFNIRIFL